MPEDPLFVSDVIMDARTGAAGRDYGAGRNHTTEQGDGAANDIGRQGLASAANLAALEVLQITAGMVLAREGGT